jgi:hypothetical protein
MKPKEKWEMARLIWTEPALLNLDEIAGYIAPDDPTAASKIRTNNHAGTGTGGSADCLAKEKHRPPRPG